MAATTEEDEAQQDEVILNPVNTESESKIAGEQIQDPTRASSLQRSPTPKQRVWAVIFVVQGLKNNFLGFPAIQKLCLIKRFHSVNTVDTIKQQFTEVFKGRSIKLDNTTLYSLYTPRNVCLPLRKWEECERMEEWSLKSINQVCWEGDRP